MAKSAEPVAARLYLSIATELERAIEQGRHMVGGRLPAERELAEQFGVSRPVIREALIVLELRGMVQTRPGAGVYVTAARPAPVAASVDADAGPFEVTEARRLLEGEIAALAAATISERQLDELEALIARIADMNTDQATREQADRAFHVALARASGNNVLATMVESLWDMRYKSPICAYFFGRARDAGIQPPADEHRLVLAALRARDAEGARRAMREHLTRVTQSLLAATEADALDRARLRVEERRYDFARRAGVKV